MGRTSSWPGDLGTVLLSEQWREEELWTAIPMGCELEGCAINTGISALPRAPPAFAHFPKPIKSVMVLKCSVGSGGSRSWVQMLSASLTEPVKMQLPAGATRVPPGAAARSK